MAAVPTPAQLEHLDDDALERLAATWRTQALRGDREANGVAHALGSRAAQAPASQPAGAAAAGAAAGCAALVEVLGIPRRQAPRPGGAEVRKKALPRRLHNGHFAFMRALAQGLDERASWDRYLRLEGEHTDLRTVRKTIAWIRDEFAAAAKRESRPGTARLILLDTDRVGVEATDYRSFLETPPATWCGPRHQQRWSPLWRPLEGPLAPAALRHSLTILRSLLAFLMSQGYVTGNPFETVALPSHPQRPLGSSRTLTFAQWDHVDALLENHVDTEVGRRLRRGMSWLYATRLRLAEITHVKCEDLAQVEYKTADGTVATGWMLSVIGKAGRSRQVPVPAALVDELGDEPARHGFERQVGAASNHGIHVMARFDIGFERPASWSASGLYQAIKAFLANAADSLEGVDA